MTISEQDAQRLKHEQLLYSEIPELNGCMYLSFSAQAIYEHITQLKGKLALLEADVDNTYAGKYEGEL